ncbi:MAG: hypothetical protein GOVbin4206_27 [Prokaryotic dsDNA virus sp.]|nr:MAG: hypothetical protein GOVbin4206_27 [Prokaryotic dsDNA virus sp.]
MSKGKEWEVCMRRNGSIMMKVNVDPVIMDRDTCISVLYDSVSWKENEVIKTMKKKGLKDILKQQARYLAYYGYIEHAPPNRKELIEENERYKDTWSLEKWDMVARVFDRHFPDFRFLAGE